MSHESERRFPGLDDLRPEDIWVNFRTGPLPEPSPGWTDWDDEETITVRTCPAVAEMADGREVPCTLSLDDPCDGSMAGSVTVEGDVRVIRIPGPSGFCVARLESGELRRDGGTYHFVLSVA